jgi:hypothetical protein
LRREGGKPSTVHPTAARGVINFCKQGNTGLQQHGPDNQHTAELQHKDH